MPVFEKLVSDNKEGMKVLFYQRLKLNTVIFNIITVAIFLQHDSSYH